MKKIILGATLALLTFTTAKSMAQSSRVEQLRVERRMANMESISIRKSLDGLLRGDYVEQLFVDATSLNIRSPSYLDIIVDDRVIRTVTLNSNLNRYTFPIHLRNGEDYTRILIRARGNVYLASVGVLIRDNHWRPQPPPPMRPEPPRPPRPPVRPRPPQQPPFSQGEFCNGSTVIHWECGQGANGAVPQGNGCYHTDTGRFCGSRPPVRPEPPRPPAEPFKSGEFCNGATVIHWECGQGATGAVPQGNGCYHTDTGRGCR